MGSNITKQRQPRGPRAQRKPALVNKRGPPRPAGYNTGSDPLGTDLFEQAGALPRETQHLHNERTLQDPKTEVLGRRSAPNVHYENDNDTAVNRDGLHLSETNRMGRDVSPRPSDSRWPGQENVPDYNRRYYRPRIPYHYGQQQYARHPGPYSYPYRTIPRSIFPYYSQRPRSFMPYNSMYGPHGSINEQYRPVTGLYNFQHAVPVGERPPPYQTIEAMRSGRDGLPKEQPQPVQIKENILQYQNGAEEDRIQHDNNGRNKQISSLLSPEHLADAKPFGDFKPRSVISIHEKDDDVYIGANLKFYRNQTRFRPDGETIDYIHKYWYGNYSLLEKLHTYIQWLFPLYEGSRVNLHAVPLRAHEARHISEDPETRTRLLTSFLMMLDFYGFSMSDDETGKIDRAANWKERFINLIRSSPNHSRITRILKSLGELGHSRLQTPFVLALFHEVFETKNLSGIPPVVLHHWLRAINDDFERTYVFKQFKQGLTRQEEARQHMKRKYNSLYYFEQQQKAFDETNRKAQFANKTKLEI